MTLERSLQIPPRAIFWLLFAFALSFTFFAIQSGDCVMYLALARDFLLKGRWPVGDPYLYSIPQSQLHIAHEYLSYLIFYGAWLLCGYAGLIFLKMLILATMFAVVLRAPLRERNLSPLWMALWILAVVAGSFRFIERSSLFSDLFSVVLIYWVVEQKQITRGWILKLIALFAIWVQLHPGFLMGVAILGLWTAWHLVFTPDFRNRKILYLILPLVVLALNPLGIDGALYPLLFGMQEAAVLKLHNLEWFPSYHPAFRFTPEVIAFWTLAIATLFLMWRERAWLTLRGVLALFAMVSAVYAVRFVPWASFALLLLIKPWAIFKWRIAPLKAMTYLLTATMLLITIHNFGWGYNSSSGPRKPALGLDSHFFPEQTLQFLKTQPITGRVYNAHDFGAYMIWSGFYPIFHHGFVTDMNFYENEVTGIFRSSDKFFELVKKYNWTMLLVDKNGGYPYFYKILKDRTDWKIVAEDDASYLIYCMPTPPNL